MLREASQLPNKEGARLRVVLDAGGLVDDETVTQALIERISHADCSHGFLLDGFPRTVAQARFLDEFAETANFGHPLVLHLDVPEDVLLARTTSRRECPDCG